MAKLNLEIDSKEAIDIARIWSARIESSNKVYDAWSRFFLTDKNEDYYYGKQWDTYEDEFEDSYREYVTNEIFTAIGVKMPSLLFQMPVFSIRPKPSRMDYDPDAAAQRAIFRQSTLNYFAGEDKTGLADATELAVLDAYFRFGVVEVGYSAEWIDNPNVKPPVLESDRGEDYTEDPEIEYQPPKLPQKERIFVKHIPSRNFRVGGLQKPENLDRCSWCGYWEWYRYDDIAANYDVDLTGGYSSDDTPDFFQNEYSLLSEESREIGDSSKLCKVWKIWDNHEKVKFTFVEGANVIIRTEDFKRLPLFGLRFAKTLNLWYPMPPVYNWISSQDEMNDVRETARQHRKRFIRRYILKKNALEESQKELLVNGPDGTVVETKDDVDPATVIIPLPNADLGAQHAEMLQVSRVDFDNIAGITPQQRGQSTDGTATETNIINERSNVRDTRDRFIVAKWLCAIGKEILIQAKEKLVENVIVPISMDSDPAKSPIGEFELHRETFMEINTDAFGDEDMDVDINVSTLSPISNEEDKKKMLEFLAIVTNYPHLNLSPTLIRTVATKVGFNDENFIQESQKMALLNLNATMAQLQLANAQLQAQSMALQNNQNAQAQGEVARNTPNTQDQIRQQMEQQVG